MEGVRQGGGVDSLKDIGCKGGYKGPGSRKDMKGSRGSVD